MNDPSIDLRIVDLVREMLMTTLYVAGPLLIVGLIVGVAVSLFQALTSVQEQTLSMVPKMIAVIAVAPLLLAPALGLLRDFTMGVFSQLIEFGTN